MSYQVNLCTSGHSFTVDPGETVLDAGLRQGIVLPYSCRIGSCGTCKARIVEGKVDYGEYEATAMTPEERAEGAVLLCQARPLSDLVIDAREVVAAEAIEIRLLPARVARLRPLAHDVTGLWLKLPANQSFNYLPGQYIDILLPKGRRRSFSIANAPGSGELEFHIRQVPGGYFTNHVSTEMKERDLLRFQGPLGTFFLRDDSARPMIFMAGGTGFAPIKAILEHAHAAGVERPVHFFWGVRRRHDLYMRDLVERWVNSWENFKFTPVLSEASAEDDWDGMTGWVHDAVTGTYPDLSGFDVYASGPPPMIEAGRAAFRKHGLPAQQLYFDSFEFARDVPKSV